MKAIDFSIIEAKEKAEEWIAFLATYSDARLERRLQIIRKQQVIAEQDANAKGWELLMLWEQITIEARIFKEEKSIPDAISEPTEELSYDEPEVATLSEKRVEVFNKASEQKKEKTSTNEDEQSQLSLF